MYDPGVEHGLGGENAIKTFLEQLETFEYGLDNNIVLLLNFLVLIILVCCCVTNHPKT